MLSTSKNAIIWAYSGDGLPIEKKRKMKMKKTTVAYAGFEKGDKVCHTQLGTLGEVIEVVGGEQGYIYVDWGTTSGNYGFLWGDISDVSLYLG